LLRNSESTYGWITKTLHWTVALLIVGLIALGWYMVGLTYYDKWYNDSLSIHKALGVLVLALACLKVIWAAVPPSPAFSTSLKPWEKIAAKSTHIALYAMMIAIPLTGYAISTSAGDSVSFFGLFDVPAVLPKSEGLRDLAIELHYYLSYGTAGVVGLHALAALKHQFIDKDDTLRKMI
jgi:cytochrome b561